MQGICNICNICTHAYITYFACVAIICTLVVTGHILHLHDEHRSDPQSPTRDWVHFFYLKCKKCIVFMGGAYVLGQVHMLCFCAWSGLPERCLAVDHRSTVERFALLPALNSVFCLCKTEHFALCSNAGSKQASRNSSTTCCARGAKNEQCPLINSILSVV
jgi:hypothetical protein